MSDVIDFPIVARPIPKPPEPKLDTDPDVRLAVYAEALDDQCKQLAIATAYMHGPRASIDMLANAMAFVEQHFDIKSGLLK